MQQAKFSVKEAQAHFLNNFKAYVMGLRIKVLWFERLLTILKINWNLKT